MNPQQTNKVTASLRPPNATAKPVQKAAKGKAAPAADGDSSDEEIKRMSEGTKKYMVHHIEKSAITQPKFRPPGGARRGMKTVIPPNYVCHRCKLKGHLISDCPTNGDPAFDIKRKDKGVPKNLKEENLPEQVEDKFIKSMINDEVTYLDTGLGIMDEFTCTLCQGIFNEPAMVPCCKINY